MATQETIEKAKSWVEKEYDDLRYSKCQCKDFVFTFRELKEMAKEAFIAGHENKDCWHDLRKNPEDLPKDNKDVLVYSGEQWRMCVGMYSPKHKSWEAGCDTIAWMEIPEPPKERSK